MPSTLNPSRELSPPYFSTAPGAGAVKLTKPGTDEAEAAKAAAQAAQALLAFAPTSSTAAGSDGLTWNYRATIVMLEGVSSRTTSKVAAGSVTLEPSVTNYIEYSPTSDAVTVNQSGFTGGATLPLWEIETNADSVTRYTDRREWLDSNGTETVLVSDTTKPTFASASINAAGDELTVNLTETDSPPILPATDIEGFTLGGVSGRSIGNGTRSDNDTITFSIAGGVVYSGESPTIEYSPGNVTDSAETPNAMDAFTAQAVTNNSTQEETVSFTISGAGTSAANGIYYEDGTLSSKPVYRKTIGDGGAGPCVYYNPAASDSWVIAPDQGSGSMHYIASGDVPLPPENGWVAWSGSNPAPTLTWS